jgi:hypothetical protein
VSDLSNLASLQALAILKIEGLAQTQELRSSVGDLLVATPTLEVILTTISSPRQIAALTYFGILRQATLVDCSRYLRGDCPLTRPMGHEEVRRIGSVERLYDVNLYYNSSPDTEEDAPIEVYLTGSSLF